MARPSPEDLSIAELVTRTKHDYGMTWADMADQLGRSDRMVRKLARGESSGESFRQSLTELYSSGRVDHLTPRRRRADGSLAPVRAKRGEEVKSRTPTDTRGRRMASVRRGRFSVTTQHLGGGNRIDEIEMPVTKNSQGRKKAWAAFQEKMLSTTKSQAQKDKRVRVTITTQDADGQRRSYQIGTKSGFHASDVRADIKTDHGGSPESWAAYQLSAVYPDTGGSIVGVQLSVADAARPKTVRIEEDRARTRRRRWSGR